MVHPELTQDPLNRQGYVERVSAIATKTVTVLFKDGVFGKYYSSCLLTLLPGPVISQGIHSNINEQSAENQKHENLFSPVMGYFFKR